MNKREFLTTPPPEVRTTPEWGAVYIRMIDGLEFESLQNKIKKNGTSDVDNMVEVIARVVVDSEGSRLFADDDRDALRRIPIHRLITIGKLCMEVNGFAEEVDELAEKSETIT